MGKRIPVLANISLGALTIYATLGLYFFSGVSLMVIIYLAFGLAFFGIGLWVRLGERAALVASAVAAGVFFAISVPVSEFPRVPALPIRRHGIPLGHPITIQLRGGGQSNGPVQWGSRGSISARWRLSHARVRCDRFHSGKPAHR